MTGKQKILKAFYPVLMGINRLTGTKNTIAVNRKMISPSQSIYDLSVKMNSGDTRSMEMARGKMLLLVNTASDCGYTEQYQALQELQDRFKDKLLVIGFPSNDFKNQEKGTDEEIAQFCKINFGIRFPLAAKSSVKKGPDQNPVFRWLTDKKMNGWNLQAPSWNFSKYLINEYGVLTHCFDPGISPLSDLVISAIEHPFESVH